MQATIRYSEDRDTFEFQAPGTDEFFEPQEVPDEGCIVFDDSGDSGKVFMVTLYNYEGEDLEADCCYELIKAETAVEDAEDDGADDEEEDEQESEDVTSVTGNGSHG